MSPLPTVGTPWVASLPFVLLMARLWPGLCRGQRSLATVQLVLVDGRRGNTGRLAEGCGRAWLRRRLAGSMSASWDSAGRVSVGRAPSTLLLPARSLPWRAAPWPSAVRLFVAATRHAVFQRGGTSPRRSPVARRSTQRRRERPSAVHRGQGPLWKSGLARRGDGASLQATSR
jgi:hypothetical protein